MLSRPQLCRYYPVTESCTGVQNTLYSTVVTRNSAVYTTTTLENVLFKGYTVHSATTGSTVCALNFLLHHVTATLERLLICPLSHDRLLQSFQPC